MTKQEALNKIEELKKYVSEEESKEVIGISIKNRYSGEIIYQSTKATIKEAVEEAVSKGISLENANLENANLENADLENAKFYGKGGTIKLTKAQLPDFLNALGFQVEE